MEGAKYHQYLEFSIDEDCSNLPEFELATEPFDEGHQVIAFGGGLLYRLKDLSKPREYTTFPGFKSARGGDAPSTQRDLFIWLSGNKRDELFERALAWQRAMKPIANLELDEYGFIYRDSRDLTGFVDGSANPKYGKRLTAALVAEGQCAGGSFVLAQRWVHNLEAFNELTVTDQEKVIGRTKEDSIELTGDDLPINSHVARTDINREGEAVKIYRRSTPIGGIDRAGLFFLAFSADQQRFRWLLESMYGHADDHVQDHLLDFSTPVSGSYFYAPPKTSLPAIFSKA